MSHIVTKESLMEMLNTDNRAKIEAVVGRALVVLMENQTEDEKRDVQTRHNNNIGFAGSDARSGTLTAYYYLKHKSLQDWQIEKWTRLNRKGEPRLAKYWRQLDARAQVNARKAKAKG